MKKTIVNPTFRLDVDGKLFKNKDNNQDIQNTLIFNDLFTRLSINKGDLPLFPELGLKQWLHELNFITSDKVNVLISDFEKDIEYQMNQDCSIIYTLDEINKHIKLELHLSKMKYSIDFKYYIQNNSIKVIDYKLKS